MKIEFQDWRTTPDNGFYFSSLKPMLFSVGKLRLAVGIAMPKGWFYNGLLDNQIAFFAKRGPSVQARFAILQIGVGWHPGSQFHYTEDEGTE